MFGPIGGIDDLDSMLMNPGNPEKSAQRWRCCEDAGSVRDAGPRLICFVAASERARLGVKGDDLGWRQRKLD